jgi:hypothetical protein
LFVPAGALLYYQKSQPDFLTYGQLGVQMAEQIIVSRLFLTRQRKRMPYLKNIIIVGIGEIHSALVTQ